MGRAPGRSRTDIDIDRYGYVAGVDGDPEWLAARLASVCLSLDFDAFVESAVRLISDDIQVTAVIQALDRSIVSQHDECSVRLGVSVWPSTRGRGCGSVHRRRCGSVHRRRSSRSAR